MNCSNKTCGFGFITSHKTMIAVLFILFLIAVNTQTQMLNDYPEGFFPKPEMRHDPAGSFIKLKCKTNLCNHKNVTFKWDFKACGPDLEDKPNCRDSENVAWVPILEKNKFEQCSSRYLLKKASGRNSGLYRCSVHFGDFEKPKIVKIYQLYVVDRYDYRKVAKPKLITIQPINSTTVENSKIVIQCKFYSNTILPPEIIWLKHLNAPITNNLFFTFNNKSYLKLNSSQMEIGNSTFVSKLIIEKSSENDTGVYTCLAVNICGRTETDVYVDVIAFKKDWQGTTSFSLLFLIPVCFALIPISGWLCVHYYRKRKLRKLQTNVISDLYKYQLVLNQRNLYRRNEIFQENCQRIH